MRVLMLTPDEGHLDRRIAHEAASMSKRGMVVDIYSAVDPYLRFEGRLAENVRLLTIPRPIRSASLSRQLLRTLKARVQGFAPALGRLAEATQYRSRDITREIVSANRARLIDEGTRYDLLVAHDIPVLPLALELREAWGTPVICDLHEIFPEQTAWITSERGRQYWREVESNLRSVDGIIAVNEGVATYVRDRYAPRAPMTVVLNSLPYVSQRDLRSPTLRDYYPIPIATKTMVWAGSLRSQTNLETVMRGFGRAQLSGWALAVLGEGPNLRSLHRVIREENLLDRVFIGKRAPQDALVPLAASADVGLLPYLAESFNLRISTPNKLFEYLQARVPIATSNLPEIVRLVAGTGTCAFVDFHDESSTALGLRSVVEWLPQISSGALEEAARQFSWERDEVRLLSLVDRVLGA